MEGPPAGSRPKPRPRAGGGRPRKASAKGGGPGVAPPPGGPGRPQNQPINQEQATGVLDEYASMSAEINDLLTEVENAPQPGTPQQQQFLRVTSPGSSRPPAAPAAGAPPPPAPAAREEPEVDVMAEYDALPPVTPSRPKAV